MDYKKLTLYFVLVISLVISFIYDKQIYLYLIQFKLPFFNYFFLIIHWLGTGYGVFVLATLLFMKKRSKLSLLWLSFFSALAITGILKYTVLRPRPHLVLGVVALITKDSPAFPSGHTTSAFSVVPLIFKNFRYMKCIWLIFALLVAYSRVYIGIHYLSDVLGGVIIGLFFGDLYLYLEKKYKLTKHINKKWSLKNIFK